MPVTDDQMSWAVEMLVDKKGAASRARAAHEYNQKMEKAVLAKIYASAPPDCKTQGDRENYARSHPDYLAHLDQIKATAFEDYEARNKREAARAVIEAWRTEQSNQRTLAGVR